MNSLLRKRRTVSDKVANFENILVQHAVTPLTPQQAQVHLQDMTSVKDKFDILHDEIADKCSDVDFPAHATEYHQLMDRLTAAMATLVGLIPTPQTTTANATTTAKPEVKLPRLDMPSFSGDYLNWTSFHDLFVASVHKNKSLSDAQKLQYLKTAVKGDAAHLIKSITISDTNYKEAWDILTNRYQNKKQICFAHLKNIFSQPTLQSESTQGLRRLVDVTVENLRALQTLGGKTEEWDWILVFLTSGKLDPDSRRQWELEFPTTDIPTWKEMVTFLEARCRALEASSTTKPRSIQPQSGSKPTQQPRVHHSATESTGHSSQQSQSHAPYQRGCPICKGSHGASFCESFRNLSLSDRNAEVRKLNLCVNCLSSGHSANDCKNKFSCKECQSRHHTLLHRPKPTQSQPEPEKPTIVATHHSSGQSNQVVQVLLATALIRIKDKTGKHQICRALLDQGSQASFLTEHCAQRLNLHRKKSSAPISGLGSVGVGSTQGLVQINFSSLYDSSEHRIEAFILPKLTGNLPSHPISSDSWPHISRLKLADPHFGDPSPIDVLLGADIYALLMRSGRHLGPPGSPIAQESILGWILSGPVNSSHPTSQIITHHAVCELDNTLKKFWELEELPATTHLTQEEKMTEEHFSTTHRRNSDGRYIVRLPFKPDPKPLGSSRDQAVNRFLQLERRLINNQSRYDQYRSFMQEYLALGHMRLVPHDSPLDSQGSPRNPNVYYIPHHFVVKESSSTTKLRVVFDASAKTTTGISLNEQLMVGPKLQDDIIPLLIRFRSHPIALSADIAKMYRQILIHPSDVDHQRILWRESKDLRLQEYQLLTVTYGTASAPYQATKCLQQLALDEGEGCSEAAKVMTKDFYVDDLMSGARTQELALSLQQHLRTILGRGGFDLRKWSSNCPALLESLPPELRETNLPLTIDTDESLKTLGIEWHPAADVFQFAVSIPTHEVITKRILLSDLAKVFDPLGWLSPVTINAKMTFQALWKIDLGWDDPLPSPFNSQWKSYMEELPSVGQVKIPRCLIFPEDSTHQLHAFCDASEKAYAAAVYLVSTSQNGEVQSNLIAAKTKVAPAKQVSLPRLELCGALLVSRLNQVITQSIGLQIDQIHFWSDSTIVLAWLSSPPHHWKTFVANRVAEIQDIPGHWHHVVSQENPADCASRGIPPSTLAEHSLWWHGPSWLTTDELNLHITQHAPQVDVQVPEEKAAVLVAHIAIDPPLIYRDLPLTTMQRIIALCLKFIKMLRPPQRIPGPLTAKELEFALLRLICWVQASEFAQELKCLKEDKPLPSRSKLLCLNPILDKDGVLRVGGRLRNSQLPLAQKFPILLPRKHRLTQLIVTRAHLDNLHAGPQLLLATLQRRYWILCGRDVVRHIVRKCIDCHRQNAASAQQMMGNLPAARITPSRPFLQCGLDYAGPFTLKVLKGRGHKTFKGYISLFVCFATRAIHLELVSDLSTAAFIPALMRFVARRGKPAHIYSDCGTNFVGADKELQDFLKLVKSTQHNTAVDRHLSKEGIQWHFNPPSAPHFGGLWEAGVKSVKHHLRRVVGSTPLNFEEMSTLLTQIEACLNSRPLTPLSSDPSDLSALTPGHFLIGDALTSVPEPDYSHITLSRLSRWQLTQKLLQDFWKQWSSEYLSRLQQRPKWLKKTDNLKVDDLVLIKDERLPPLQWKLGRIITLHPGSDNLTRAVTVKTADGQFKRPIAKLSPLPIDSDF